MDDSEPPCYDETMTFHRIAIGIGIIGLSASAVVSAPAAAGTVKPAAALAVSLDCQAIGNSAYQCFADVAGGVAPYIYHWYDGHTGESDVNKCQSFTHATVSVTVNDSAGASASGSQSFACDPGPA